MKIRRYTCNNMQEALLKVKMDLGSEAVIMNSRKVRRKGLFGLFRKPLIEVVAAIDDDYVRPSRTRTRATPASGANIGSYYENAQPSGHQSGVFSQPPAYGQAQMPYQTQTQQTAPGPQPSVPPQPQPQYHPQQELQQQTQPNRLQTQQPQQQSKPLQTASTAQNTAGSPNTTMSPANNPKLVELETKVKNMETMLEQIYLSVKDKDGPIPAGPAREKAETPATAGQDDLSVIRRSLAEMELDSILIDRIVDKVRERGGSSERPDEALSLAARVMTVLLGEPDTIKLRSDGRPQVVIFVGPTGVGKTTTLAKIAADFTLNRQKKVGLITADTYRIAAVEQLKTYSEILNIPVLVVYSPNEVQEAIKELSDKDLILIDTAGRSHRNKSHFDGLKSVGKLTEDDETYLVVSANTSRHALKEILEYYSFIKDYKLLFTKLDEAPVPGVIVNARYLTGRPLSYTTAGQSVPDDLDVASPRAIVASLLGSGTIK